MRYFDEITGQQIENPDLTKGEINEQDNIVTHTYVVDHAEVGHEEVIATYPNGGKDIKWVVDSEEVGHWKTSDSRGDVPWTTPIPEDWPHDTPVTDVEKIGIYHTYTPEEIEEKKKKEEESKERNKRSSEAQAYQKNLMANEINQAAIDHDAATTTIYETVGTSAMATAPFSAAYARQIIRGEKTISQCPSVLRTEIQSKIAEKPRTDSFFQGRECTPDNTPAKVTAGTTVAIKYTPQTGYRMPTREELPDWMEYAARDLDDNIIPDYLEKNMSYSSFGNEAVASVYITDNLRDILLRLSAIEIEE